MTNMLTVEEIDTQIREHKEKIKELQKQKEEILNSTALTSEKRLFIDKGYEASETLRFINPELYNRKCREAGFRHSGFLHGLTKMHHNSKWEQAKIKACYHASHGRAKYVKHLTDEELTYAKIYAKAFTKEWIEFWEGSVTE